MLPKARVPIRLLEKNLLKGARIPVLFKEVGFNDYEITVLSLAEVHGDFVGSFELIGERLKTKQNQRQQMIKVLAYPLLLICFLLGILLGLRHLILPEVSSSIVKEGVNWGQLVIQKGPEYIGIAALLVLGSLAVGYVLTRKLSQLDRMKLFTKVPIIGYYLKYTLTAFFANEIGKLLAYGLEMKDILRVLGTLGENSLTREFSQQIGDAYEQGIHWEVTIQQMSFLRPEFSQIILRGEGRGKVGEELVLYSKRLWKELNNTHDKALLWLQPIIFFSIAMVILSVYSALLLPIYQEMEGNF